MNAQGKNHPYKHKFIVDTQFSFVNPLTTSRLFRCLSFYDYVEEQIDQACDCTMTLQTHDIYVTKKYKTPMVSSWHAHAGSGWMPWLAGEGRWQLNMQWSNGYFRARTQSQLEICLFQLPHFFTTIKPTQASFFRTLKALLISAAILRKGMIH